MAAVTLAVALAMGGCQAILPARPPSTVVPATVTATPGIDFTQPGAAAAMVGELLKTASAKQVVMVEVGADEVAVCVLVNGAAVTWAYRDGRIGPVATDIVYVDQAAFDVSDFNLDDVGALFRAAAAVSGSTQSQTLQIVDYSGGRVMMSVATNPESRTVFFNPDGSLLEDLDFATLGGEQRGLDDVRAQVPAAYTVSVQSDQGVWMDSPGEEQGTIVRRQRTSRVPVTTVTRTQGTTLKTFSPALVDPAAIWSVVKSQVGTTVSADTAWSVTIDDRSGHGLPRMYFTFGLRSLVTDLAGNPMS